MTKRNIARAEALLRIAESLGIPELLVLGHSILGSTALLVSSPVEAGERLSRALEILQTIDFPLPATAYTLDLVSSRCAVNTIALVQCAKFEQATESIRACRERLSEIDHDYSKASSLSVFVIAWLLVDDPETARSTAEATLTVVEGRGFHTTEAIARIIRGWARACQGEADEGVKNVEGGIALAETSGSDVLSSALYVAAADTYRMAKDRARAQELLEQASGICERDGSAPAVGLQWIKLIIRTHVARLAPHTGKVREAHDRLAASYAGLTEGFDRPPACEAKAALDELAARIGAASAAS